MPPKPETAIMSSWERYKAGVHPIDAVSSDVVFDPTNEEVDDLLRLKSLYLTGKILERREPRIPFGYRLSDNAVGLLLLLDLGFYTIEQYWGWTPPVCSSFYRKPPKLTDLEGDGLFRTASDGNIACVGFRFWGITLVVHCCGAGKKAPLQTSDSKDTGLYLNITPSLCRKFFTERLVVLNQNGYIEEIQDTDRRPCVDWDDVSSMLAKNTPQPDQIITKCALRLSEKSKVLPAVFAKLRGSTDGQNNQKRSKDNDSLATPALKKQKVLNSNLSKIPSAANAVSRPANDPNIPATVAKGTNAVPPSKTVGIALANSRPTGQGTVVEANNDESGQIAPNLTQVRNKPTPPISSTQAVQAAPARIHKVAPKIGHSPTIQKQPESVTQTSTTPASSSQIQQVGLQSTNATLAAPVNPQINERASEVRYLLEFRRRIGEAFAQFKQNPEKLGELEAAFRAEYMTGAAPLKIAEFDRGWVEMGAMEEAVGSAWNRMREGRHDEL